MRSGLVFDASVLIDIASVDVAILGLIQAHVADVVIPVIVLGEVEALDEPTARALGLTLAESTTSQREEALARPRSLSFADYTCFVTTRDLGMACVTNDGALANHCVATGVLVTRGLRPLINLVEVGQLTALVSLRVVRAIHRENRFITRMVVVSFAQEVWRVRRSSRPTT